MSRTVIALPAAEADIRRNVRWMCRHSTPSAAARWQTAVDRAIVSLTVNPERHPEADEAAEIGIDLRSLLTGRRPHVFRILFTYDAATVYVHRIMHAAQDRLTADDL